VKKPIIIGLVGPKQAGKTTVSNMIMEFTNNAKEVALADKLKDVCGDVFGLDRIHFDSQDLKEVPFEKPIVINKGYLLEILLGFDVDPKNVDMDAAAAALAGRSLISPRDIAQTIGTDFLRNFVDSDIHVKSVNLNRGGITIIGDNRFINEFYGFKNMPGVEYHGIYIYRKSKEDLVTMDSHISEREFFTFKDQCVILDNNGSLKDLERGVKTLLDTILSEGKNG
jgi:hypothetical protein